MEGTLELDALINELSASVTEQYIQASCGESGSCSEQDAYCR